MQLMPVSFSSSALTSTPTSTSQARQTVALPPVAQTQFSGIPHPQSLLQGLRQKATAMLAKYPTVTNFLAQISSFI